MGFRFGLLVNGARSAPADLASTGSDMRINFFFYLDEVNQRRVRPRVLWGFYGFLLGGMIATIVALMIP